MSFSQSGDQMIMNNLSSRFFDITMNPSARSQLHHLRLAGKRLGKHPHRNIDRWNTTILSDRGFEVTLILFENFPWIHDDLTMVVGIMAAAHQPR